MRKFQFIVACFFMFSLIGCQSKPPTIVDDWVIMEEGGSFHTGDRLIFKEEGIVTLNGWTSEYEIVESGTIKIAADSGNLMWGYKVTTETLTLFSKNSKHDMKVSAQRIHLK